MIQGRTSPHGCFFRFQRIGHVRSRKLITIVCVVIMMTLGCARHIGPLLICFFRTLPLLNSSRKRHSRKSVLNTFAMSVITFQTPDKHGHSTVGVRTKLCYTADFLHLIQYVDAVFGISTRCQGSSNTWRNPALSALRF